MDKRKVLFRSCVGGGSLLLVLAIIWGVLIWKNTTQAQETANELIAELSEGKLKEVQRKYYAIPERSMEERQQSVLTNDEGNAVAQFITDQELTMIYGEELVTAGEEENADDSNDLLSLVMKYSRITSKVRPVFGSSHTSMKLTLTGPDFIKWMEEIPEEEAMSVFLTSEDIATELESRLAAGEVPVRTTVLKIPMVKQYGSWRFKMTEEMESELVWGEWNISSD